MTVGMVEMVGTARTMEEMVMEEMVMEEVMEGVMEEVMEGWALEGRRD